MSKKLLIISLIIVAGCALSFAASKVAIAQEEKKIEDPEELRMKIEAARQRIAAHNAELAQKQV